MTAGSRARFAYTGTPRQQACKVKWLLEDLRRDAARARRHAENLDRLAAKVESDRLAGKQLDRNHATRAIELKTGFIPLAHLLGLWGSGKLPDDSSDWPRVLRSALWPTTARAVPFKKWDPVAAACAIARSARADDDLEQRLDKAEGTLRGLADRLRKKAEEIYNELDDEDA